MILEYLILKKEWFMSFSYHNYQSPLKRKRNHHISSQWIQKVFAFAFSFVFLFFVTVKTLWTIFQKKRVTFQASVHPHSEIQKIKMPSLLINLKTKEGPRLARITVHIETKDDLIKKELISNNKSLEKYLVLILSGQDAQDVHNKKNIFEGKIKSQVNAFLSRDLIHDVNIQTQLIN